MLRGKKQSGTGRTTHFREMGAQRETLTPDVRPVASARSAGIDRVASLAFARPFQTMRMPRNDRPCDRRGRGCLLEPSTARTPVVSNVRFSISLGFSIKPPPSGFCSRPVLGGGTAVEQPGRERRAAARRRSLEEQRRPSPAFGRRRRSRDRESMQCRSMDLGIVRACKAAGSAHAPPVPSVTTLKPT